MDDLNTLRKRLFYNSWHRGCKETDLLLGKFAEKHLDNFEYQDLILYEEFLKQDDADIFNWMTKKIALPENLKNNITKLIMEFSFSAN